MDEKLKNCQCGGKAILYQERDSDNHTIIDYMASCIDCHIHTLWDNNQNKVIEIWNNRKNEDSLKKRISQLIAEKGRELNVENLSTENERLWKAIEQIASEFDTGQTWAEVVYNIKDIVRDVMRLK